MSPLPTVPRTFESRIAELGFTLPLPPEWISHPLPPEEPDFSDPTKLLPLALVTAPHSALIVAIAARPAYDNGTLHDWARYLLEHNSLNPRALGEHVVGTLPALVGEAVQPSEMGPMVVRFAFCEDGRRLLNLTLSAPEMLADSVQGLWFEILARFALTTPRGPTVPVFPAATPAPSSASPAEPTPVEEPGPDATSVAPESFIQHALAEDSATLDPEHPINANLRDRGIGLTPRLLALHPEDRKATLGAGALAARIDVPFGWHVIDDGKRTLLLDPSGAVQIHLHLLPREGRDDAGILDHLEADTRASYPEPECLRFAQGNLFALVVRGIHDGDQPIEQIHLLQPVPGRDLLMRARITSTPERAKASANLAELIFRSADFGATSAG